MLKKIKTSEAVGLKIAHDMTKIIPGEYKGARFTRGHTVTGADIDELLSMGKEHIYVMEEGEEPGVHEEEAARRLAGAVAGDNTTFGKPREGRINITSIVPGLLKINRQLLDEINSIEGISAATLHSNTPVKAGGLLAGVKAIPLYIEEEKLKQVEALARAEGKAVRVKPYTVKKVGIIVTGNEVYNGLIQDKFAGVIEPKLEALGAGILASTIVPDDEDLIGRAVVEMKEKGAELIVTCGGLSVDPDDVTLEGVKRSGARIISYGSPIMPGAMSLLAVLGDTPVLGAPAGGLFHTTSIDILLPRLIAGEIITRQEIAGYGYGGLCLNCTTCQYPVCPYCR